MRESIQTLGVTIFPTLALSEVKWSPQSPCVSLGLSLIHISEPTRPY